MSSKTANVSIKISNASVVITRYLNCYYLKTGSGLLNLLNIILGAISIGYLGKYYPTYTSGIFYLPIATAFLTISFIVFCTCFFTNEAIEQTFHDLIYHIFATILVCAAAIWFLASVTTATSKIDALLASSILGIINGIVYFIGTIVSVAAYT